LLLSAAAARQFAAAKKRPPIGVTSFQRIFSVNPAAALPAGTARKASGHLAGGTGHHANNEKQEVPTGELPAVHIAIVCGFNRKFYKQCNSQQLVCDMQFTVVANESNRELRWQGASAGAHPVFVLYLIF